MLAVFLRSDRAHAEILRVNAAHALKHPGVVATGGDDVGNVITPFVAEGQVHGGVLQGAGQAFTEQTLYDPANGQLLSGSFMDNCYKTDCYADSATLIALTTRVSVSGFGRRSLVLMA